MQRQDLSALLPEYAHSFMFLGEAGCGKSEIALNLALALAAQGDKPVHFFDLDMTKPLFRSRDQAAFLESCGVTVHFEEQFYDAPTTTGGVTRLLQDEGCYTVLDVGGDYIGARSVGGYAPWLNRPGAVCWYVVNPYRPWSMDLEHIDSVLGQVLGVSHVRLERLRMIANPNLGLDTTAEEVLDGAEKVRDMLSPYKDIDFTTVQEDLTPELKGRIPGKVFPLRLMLTYEWNT
jgi:hypothetical protein